MTPHEPPTPVTEEQLAEHEAFLDNLLGEAQKVAMGEKAPEEVQELVPTFCRFLVSEFDTLNTVVSQRNRAYGIALHLLQTCRVLLQPGRTAEQTKTIMGELDLAENMLQQLRQEDDE